jgi:hypothetical protein
MNLLLRVVQGIVLKVPLVRSVVVVLLVHGLQVIEAGALASSQVPHAVVQLHLAERF